MFGLNMQFRYTRPCQEGSCLPSGLSQVLEEQEGPDGLLVMLLHHPVPSGGLPCSPAVWSYQVASCPASWPAAGNKEGQQELPQNLQLR